MSHDALSWALSLRGIRATDKVVLLVLADRHVPGYGAWPPLSHIAEACCLSESGASKALARLKFAGLIRRDWSDKTRRVFRLAFEDGTSAVDASPAPSPARSVQS